MAKSKKLIQFNQNQFDQANHKFKQYQKAVDDVLTTIENETGIKLNDQDIREGRAFETLQRKFGEHHKENNTLKLKPIKLMELMDVDFYSIVRQLDAIKMLPVKDQPTKERFSIYAETKAELERLETAQTAIEMLNKMNIKNNMDLRNPMQFDTTGVNFKPSVQYVKNG